MKETNVTINVTLDENNIPEKNEGSYIIKLLQIDLNNIFFKGKDITTFKALIILTTSIVLISVACKQLVTSSEHLSEIFNINLFLSLIHI